MPAKAESRKVLDGRAEVLSYKNKPDVFYLRAYVPEREGYRSLKIEGVSDLDTACKASLDVYLDLSKADKPRVVRDKTSSSTRSSGVKKVLLTDAVAIHLKEQQDRVHSGIIKQGYWDTIQPHLNLHFLPYCQSQGLVYTRDIKMGCLDAYPTFKLNSNKRSTVKTQLTTIKAFFKALARKRLLDPYEAALIEEIVPKIKLRDIDLSANPPFRDETEWLEFVKVLHQWVKEGEKTNNPKILYYRRRFWSLVMCLKQSGARPGEMLSLKWSDIETEDIGRFSETKEQEDFEFYRQQGWSEADIKDLPEEAREAIGIVPRYITHLRIIDTKTGTPREVTCNSAEVLSRLKKFQLERVAYLNKKYPATPIELTPDTKVFDYAMGGNWISTKYDTYTKTWIELMERAKDRLKGPLLSDEPYHIYSLRSTRAQELLHLGVDVAVAAKSLGHSASTMLRVYARLPVRSQAMKAAVDGIQFGRTKTNNKIVELDDV